MTEATVQTGRWHAVAAFLGKARGDRRWDVLLLATAVGGLIGIPVVLAVPRSVVLVWFTVLSLPANSPLSPIIPAAFEPLIMEAAKFEHPLLVTALGLVAYMYTEYLNYHTYAWVLNWERLAGVRGSRSVEWGVAHFDRAPFWTVVVFAFTPLPFWVARCLSILHGYSVRRHMAATAAGRFPRILVYAWLGAKLQVPGLALLAVVVGGAAIVIAWKLARGERVLSETVLESPGPAPASA